MSAQTVSTRQANSLSALRNLNFRLYFFGQMISNSGTWMQNIAQSYLVFQITRSELWLGIVACAGGLPVVLLSPIGGVVVERVPRKTVLQVTQFTQMLLALILAALTFTNTVQVWHIVLLATLLGATNAFDIPARQTIIVEMVGREDLNSGIALNSIMNSLGRILGPAAAGFTLVQFGASWCFLLNGLSYVVVIVCTILMKVPFAIQYTRQASPLRQLREGLSFARNDALITPLLLLAGVGGLLVLSFLRLLPAAADVMLNSPEEGYAALSIGEGLGAVICGLLIGWLGQRFGHGRLVVAAIIINALANIILAWQTTIPPAVLMTAFFGASMIMLFVSLNTILQTVVPDNFRARVLALYSLAMMGTAPFGSLALGAFADRFGVQAAFVLNGTLIIILSGAIFLRWPNLVRYNNKADRISIPEEVVPAIGD